MSLVTLLESAGKSWLRAWPKGFVPNLITSSVVAMMTVVLCVSFVALIFVDPIAGFVGPGTSLMLLMAVIVAVFMALFSSYPGTIASPQDRIAPIMALMASLIIQQMRGRATAEEIGVTVLAAIAACTVVVGLALFLLGAYRLGNIVRFIPYPVIGGFLAGSGWLLVIGSFRVVSGQSLALTGLERLYASGALASWIPCVAFGAATYLAVRCLPHYLTLPGMILGSIAVFYGGLALGHVSLDQARGLGWILGAPPAAGLGEVHPLPQLLRADWMVILHQYGSLGALLLTSIVSILLNTTALELLADEEIDLNQELRAAGLANLAGGFAGGMIGFQSLSLSALPVGMKVRSRWVGIFSALACLVLLGFGTGLLGYLPRFVLGGILFYNGLCFLAEWVVQAYFRLRWEDYLLILLILFVVAVAGYLQGVAAGIVVATVLFVVKYSAVNVISHSLSGEDQHSMVDRSASQARLLNARGGQIFILRLKGFIFFGSANHLLNTVRERQADTAQPRLAYVILDFQHVSGLDTSALVSLAKLCRLARKENFIVLAASVSDETQNGLRAAGLLQEGQLRLFRDRDYSMEWCENEILKNEMPEAQAETRSLPQILREIHPWDIDTGGLLRYFERLEFGRNHYLVLQGDPSREIHFIESGRVRVTVELDNGRAMRLRTMGPGTIIGEIGLYLDQPRVASVVTEEPCVVCRLTAEALRRMEREAPALASAFHEFMVRVLAERLAQQNRTLRALVD